MNYRHAFHAGNFADVLKHTVLIALLEALQKKPTAYCYLDTHAGRGLYDLRADEATRSAEHLSGVQRLLLAPNPPPLVTRYLDCIQQINKNLNAQEFIFYPGSPLIAANMARKHDRTVAVELHPQEFQALKFLFKANPEVITHFMDGFASLKSLLPPKERRGLILIDPPYEKINEFNAILSGVEQGIKKFGSGIFAIWYPLKSNNSSKHFLNSLAKIVRNEILIIELNTYDSLPQQLSGSGLIIINPPYQFTQTLAPELEWLWNVLSFKGQGGYHLSLLN